MTIYATLMCVVLGLTTIILFIFHIIAQSQEHKALLEEHKRMREYNKSLEIKLNRMSDIEHVSSVVKEGKRFTDWDNRSKTTKRCYNCGSRDIEAIYLEMECGIPAQAYKRCRECTATLAEFKKSDSI